MLELIDGPCKDTFMVKAAPLYLRAVITARGKKDVLDQVHDEPEPTESIHVYKREGAASTIHIKGTKGVTGFWAMAQYKHLPDVDGSTMRDSGNWRLWVVQQIAKGGKG